MRFAAVRKSLLLRFAELLILLFLLVVSHILLRRQLHHYLLVLAVELILLLRAHQVLVSVLVLDDDVLALGLLHQLGLHHDVSLGLLKIKLARKAGYVVDVFESEHLDLLLQVRVLGLQVQPR